MTNLILLALCLLYLGYAAIKRFNCKHRYERVKSSKIATLHGVVYLRKLKCTKCGKCKEVVL